MQINKKKIGFLSHLDLNLYLFRTPIMKRLNEEKNTEIYAICPKGDNNQKLRELGFKVVNYDIDRKSLNPFKEIVVIYNIYKVLKSLDLDILHTFTAKPNIYGTIAANLAKVPIVLNLVEGLGSFYLRNNFKSIMVRGLIETLYKIIFSKSNGCVFVNSDDPKYLISKGIISKNKVKIIKSVGIDTNKFDIDKISRTRINELKNSFCLGGKLIILMVSRAIEDKGVREFYNTAKKIKKDYDNIEFLLAGGLDKGNTSCVGEDFLESENVTWLGHRDDIVDLTAICDIYVLPSYREGLPVSLMEAASMKKPIVTTNAIGCRDVVDDGVNGYLVPVKDESALAEKIELLISNHELRSNMGAEGRKKMLNEFSIDIVTEQYIQYYKRFSDV